MEAGNSRINSTRNPSSPARRSTDPLTALGNSPVEARRTTTGRGFGVCAPNQGKQTRQVFGGRGQDPHNQPVPSPVQRVRGPALVPKDSAMFLGYLGGGIDQDSGVWAKEQVYSVFNNQPFRDRSGPSEALASS